MTAGSLTILGQDDGYVVVDKPAGRIVVPGRGRAADELPIRQELEAKLGRPLLVVHRLDRGTSGALLFATDAAAHRVLSQAFERHQVVKHYWALVRGSLLGAGEIDLALVPIRGGLVRAARPGEGGGKSSRTAWSAVERVGDFTIVDFRPTTGRLHQIRAHAAALGHPLAVDPDYGGAQGLPDAVGQSELGQSGGILRRTPLHALSIKFPHPRTRRPVLVESPLADDLAHAVERLRETAGIPRTE